MRVSKDTLNASAAVHIIIIPGAPPETTVGLGGLTPDAVVNQNDGDNPAYLALVGSAVGDARIATSVWTLEDGGDMDASSPFAVDDRLTTRSRCRR